MHATEDPVTLTNAVSNLLSVDARPQEETMEGHFGNAITVVKYRLTGEDATLVLERIVNRLPVPTKIRLGRVIEDRVDEHYTLFLRFDKQHLVEGRLEEGTGDSIRIKVKPRGYLLREGAREFYSKVLFGGR